MTNEIKGLLKGIAWCILIAYAIAGFSLHFIA